MNAVKPARSFLRLNFLVLPSLLCTALYTGSFSFATLCVIIAQTRSLTRYSVIEMDDDDDLRRQFVRRRSRCTPPPIASSEPLNDSHTPRWPCSFFFNIPILNPDRTYS
ncbi:hypothetical protein C8Q74DRAFT_219768 [Fomes fomentarius]|nr:hypothetical protein C8Q74DRAFT_219768 [Fomes fomentarius]